MNAYNDTYRLRFQQNSKIATVLILVPILGVLLITLPLTILKSALPEWMIFGIVMLSVFLIVCFTIYLVINKTTVDCIVRLTEEGFQYELLESSFMYTRKKFFSTWDNVSNISDSADTKNDLTFYQISFIAPSFTATFNFKQGYESDVHFFWNELQRYKNQFNIVRAKNGLIDSKGFYDTRSAWLLTQIAYLTMLALMFMKLTYSDAISWWRIAIFAVLTTTWLVNYHINRAKRRGEG